METIEFDIEQGTQYLCCIISLRLLDTRIGAICIPCVPFLAYKLMRTQKCLLTQDHLKHRYGWINIDDHVLPLDRIQNVDIDKNFLQRMFGVTSLRVDTGNGSKKASLVLHAPKHPERIRDLIMQHRDAIVQSGRVKINDGLGSIKRDQPERVEMTVFSTQEEVDELKEIKLLLHRLEEISSK